MSQSFLDRSQTVGHRFDEKLLVVTLSDKMAKKIKAAAGTSSALERDRILRRWSDGVDEEARMGIEKHPYALSGRDWPIVTSKPLTAAELTPTLVVTLSDERWPPRHQQVPTAAGVLQHATESRAIFIT
jgi:hypothetical protein